MRTTDARKLASLLCALLLSSSAAAKAWKGIEPGLSARSDVTAAFGDPAKTVTQGGLEVLAYVGPTAIKGTAQVQFRVSPTTSLVERIDVFPSAIIDRRTIESTYGEACPKNRAAQAPCYQEKLTETGQLYLLYKSLDLAVFFTLAAGTSVVESMVHLPPKRTAPRAATPPPANAGSAAEAPVSDSVAKDDGWSTGAEFAPVSGTAPQEKAVEIGGTIEAQSYLPPARAEEGKLWGRQSVDLLLTVQASRGQGRAYGALEARKDFVDGSRDRMEAAEAYVALDGAVVRLSAGRMLVAWGTANLYNPTDVLNPVDQRDLVAPEKRGAWMARLGLVLGPVLIEGYYLPIPEVTQLPRFDVAEDGTLVSQSPWVSGRLPQDGPLPLLYHLGNAAPPAPRLDTFQAAGKVSLSLGGADLSASYASLYDRLPYLSPSVQLNDPPVSAAVTLDFDYQRVHVVTFDFERPFGRLRVAGEAMLSKLAEVKEGQAEHTVLTYIAGADYLTAPFAEDKSLHFFLEFLDTRALQGTLREDFIAQLRYFNRPALLGRVSLQSGSDWHAEVTAVTLFDPLDVMVLPAVELVFSDALRARVGGTLLLGDPAGYYGLFSRNSRVELSLKASF